MNDVKKLSEVEDVSPNYVVHATLMDSVPLINADDVWKLNAQGGICAGHCVYYDDEGEGITGAAVKQATGKEAEPIDESVPPQEPGPYCKDGYWVAPTECLTGKGVTIGIIDTGVDYTHEDLGGCFGESCKVIGGWDFVNEDSDPIDDHGHGTHVAATAAGNGVLKGVAPDANIYGYKVLDSGGSGYADWIISAIDRSIDPNEDGDFSDHLGVISLSLGGSGNPDDPTSQAIDNVVDNGVVAVIAAGNSGPTGNFYCRQESGGSSNSVCSPGTARKAITVGAINKSNIIAGFSSRGPVIWDDQSGDRYSLIKPDIVAPGVTICAAQWDNWLEESFECNPTLERHIAISGTSMATPHVSGLVALVKQRNSDYTPEEVKTIIKKTSQLLPNPEKVTDQGHGMIESMDAVFSQKPLNVNLNPILQDNLIIDITGTVSGENFEHYELAYAQNVPLIQLSEENWTLIISDDQPIENDILSEDFAIPFGESLIRLRGYDTNGNYYDDYGYIMLNTFVFIEPLDSDSISPKGNLTIRIQNFHNLSVDRFNIEYSLNGSSWSNESILIDTDSLQGILLSDTITEDGLLAIKATISYEGRIEELYLELYSDTFLKVGWPVKTPFKINPSFGFGYEDNRRFEIGNINNDPNEEILVIGNNDYDIYGGSYSKSLFAFDYEGHSLSGWPFSPSPVNPSSYGQHIKSFALADLNLDGKKEIIVITTESTLDGWEFLGNVYILDENASILNMWSLPSRPHAITVGEIVTEVDGDEILIITNDYLMAFYSDGSIISGWPQAVGAWHTLQKYPAIGDIDNDNESEIVWLSCSTSEASGELFLRIYESNGTLENQWAQSAVCNTLRLKGNSPAIGDLNNDGTKEIIGIVQTDSSTWKLYVWDNLGNVLTGWPQILLQKTYGSPALANINEDNNLEIIVSDTDYFYAYSLDGSIIWYTYRGGITSDIYSIDVGMTPAVEDINGDLIPEIIFGNLILNNNGLPFGGWSPRHSKGHHLADGLHSSAFIDIDNDGIIEVIRVSMMSDEILVWEFDEIYGDQLTKQWPMFQHDPQHTGCYDCAEQPQTGVCGNGVCEEGEDAISCPADCQTLPSSSMEVSSPLNHSPEISTVCLELMQNAR